MYRTSVNGTDLRHVANIPKGTLTYVDTLPDASRADLLLALAKVASSVGSFDLALNLLDQREAIEPLSFASDAAQAWDVVMTRATILAEAGKIPEVVKLLDPLRERMLARHDDTTIKCLMMLGDSVAAFAP